MSPIEKFVYKKVSLWVLLAITVILLIISASLLIFYNFEVNRKGDKTQFGNLMIGGLDSIRETFELTLDAINGPESQNFAAKEVRFEPNNTPGFKIFKLVDKDYLLLNRFNSSKKLNVVEFWKVGNSSPIHEWIIEDYLPFSGDNIRFGEKIHPSKPETFRIQHAWLSLDGSLTFHVKNNPVYQVDECGKLIWLNDDFQYHHSLQVDSRGNFWASASAHNPTLDDSYGKNYIDDHIVQIAENGQTLYSKSVVKILEKSGLANRMYVYDQHQIDGTHLNDIEPVFRTGKYWKKDDVFMSLGHLNLIIQFRPSTDKVIWWTQDEIMHQHDVDVLDQHRISIFDNRRTTRVTGDIVLGHNELKIVDFDTGRMESPWKESFRIYDINTVTQGLADFDQNGGVMIEETNNGRLIKFDASGQLEWMYTNKKKERSRVYSLNWSRLIDKETGMQLEKLLSNFKC